MGAGGEDRPLRIVVVEPASLVREGLVLVLRDRSEVEVCGVAASLGDLRPTGCDPTVDVVVLDLDQAMASAATIEATATWRAAHPAVRVVGLHRSLENAVLRRARAIGIDILLDRKTPPEALITAVREAVSGPANGRAAVPPVGMSLTPRERSVLELIARGHTSREVASQLSVSPRTVENHKQRIFSRLGVQNQAQAVAVATRLGLLEGTEGGR